MLGEPVRSKEGGGGHDSRRRCDYADRQSYRASLGRFWDRKVDPGGVKTTSPADPAKVVAYGSVPRDQILPFVSVKVSTRKFFATESPMLPAFAVGPRINRRAL